MATTPNIKPPENQPPPSRWAALHLPGAYARFLLVILIGVGLDLWTKIEAFAKLAPGGVDMTDGVATVNDPRTYSFIPGWLHFQPMANQGAVFGIGQGQRWLFVGVSICAIGFIALLFATSGRRWLYQLILGLLMAGVIGNLYDRLEFAYVRDMIRVFPGKTFHNHEIFPYIFNVADSMLCVGVFLMLVYSFFGPAPKARKPEEK